MKKQIGIKRILTVLISGALLISGSVTPVLADEPNDQFGSVTLFSTASPGSTLNDSYYYTDDWFFESNDVCNDELALVSMQLVAATVDEGGHGAEFLTALGFENVTYVSAGTTGEDMCHYITGRKTVEKDGENKVVTAVVMESYSFETTVKQSGWTQNFVVNNGEEVTPYHYGLSRAAASAIERIAGDLAATPSALWIMGQSRGGALAGLTAHGLVQKGVVGKDQVFCYTFESPATMSSHNGDCCAGVHNYVCHDDLVTMVPPWDMVRGGHEYELATEETHDGLAEKLESLGSSLAEPAKEHMDGAADYTIQNIMDGLTGKIPTREDYSKIRTVTVNGADGSPVTLTYSYQDTIAHLIPFIFGGNTFDMASLQARLEELIPAFECLLDGVQTGSDQGYYDAGVKVKKFAADNGMELPVTDAEAYALMTLLGPLAIDKDYEPPQDDIDKDIMLTYLMPLLSIGMNAGNITFSHHFDTVIARLKLLADLPEVEDIAIEIDAPAAGDSSSKAPEDVAQKIDDLGFEYMAASSSWINEGETLGEDKVVYLQVTVTAEGHSVPDDFSMTINGAEPAEPLKIGEKDGAAVITGVWAFAVGDAGDVEISFDAGGHVEDPAAVQVPKGTRLSLSLSPDDYGVVKDEKNTWRFDGWTDKDGNTWDSLYANEPMTLYGNWTPVIDKIEITIVDPHIGESMTDPVYPEGCHYHTAYYDLTDNSIYETVEVVENKTEHSLNLAIAADEGYEFLLEMYSEEGGDFLGTVTINGEEAFALYQPDSKTLRVEYLFTPMDKPEDEDDETDEIAYRLDKGDSSYTKGSKTGLTFVFKRNVEDETTFGHFAGLAVDGKELAESNYSKKSGSVVIGLKPAYLDTLKAGSHKLSASFDDGDSVEAVFTIKEAAPAGDNSQANSGSKTSQTSSTGRSGNWNAGGNRASNWGTGGNRQSGTSSSSPKTGDTHEPLLWLALLFGAAAVLAAAMHRKTID